MKEQEANISDHEILKAYRRNKREGMELFLEKFEKPLFIHLRSILRENQDTDDAYQNTCMKIYLHLHRFSEKSSLYTWVYRIGTNEALSILRKRKRRKSTTDSVLENHNASSEVNYERLLDLLHEAIDQLPSKQQLVFQLRYYGNHSYEEIAKFTERSVGGLKANYHHARKKIEEHIKRHAEL